MILKSPLPFPPPFALPADSAEIMLDLPVPPSINRLWRYGRTRVYRSADYLAWIEAADEAVMVRKKPGRLPKIAGPFQIDILLNETMSRADSDNICAKALLDWLESRDIIRNDKDCRAGAWRWVHPDRAPEGVRVILRSIHP